MIKIVHKGLLGLFSELLFHACIALFANLIPGSGFRPQGESLSTDWDKYSTPEQSRQRATIPDDNRIVEMNVGDVRAIPLTVKHNPDHVRMNKAHTDILGLIGLSKSELNKIRSRLATLSEWVI